MWRLPLLLALCSLLTSCSHEEAAASLDDFSLRPVTLPDGTQIRAEVMTRKVDMNKGMMFRDSFPEGRGMLFIHGSPNQYGYWMYQVRVPLDIIWMDRLGKIVEIAENVPPCKTAASQCPTYGGTQVAMVVLELPGGYGRKHGVTVGNVIRF